MDRYKAYTYYMQDGEKRYIHGNADVYLADEVEKDQALRESAYVAKEIECESAKLSCKQAEDEIARLQRGLEKIMSHRMEYETVLEIAHETLAPKEEKDIFEKLPPWKMKDIDINEKEK